MSDPTNLPDPAGGPAPTNPSTGAGGAMDPSVIANGKVFAILSYVLNIVGLPFCIVPLVMKDNAFSLYHAKQALGLWIVGLGVGVVCMILMIVLNVMGLMNAINDKCATVPVVGEMFAGWFKGITAK